MPSNEALIAAAIARESWSVETWAEKLRLVTLFAGYEYIEATPDIAGVAAMLARKNEPFQIQGSDAQEVAPEPGTDTRTRHDRVVFGTDQRIRPTFTSNAPFRHDLAVVFDSRQNSISGGSAVLIGPNTALSAGHVFYNDGYWSNFNTGSPTFSFLAAGAKATATPPNNFPFNKNFCYGFWTFQCWLDDEDGYCDAAVLDFSICGSDNPATAAGYQGANFNYGTPGQSFPAVTVYGYPGHAASGFDGCPNLGAYPEVCGTFNTASAQAYYWGGSWHHTGFLISNTIDTSAGQSGTDWSIEASGSTAIGTHRGFNGEQHNFARRLDASYLWLVQQASVDY